ncbi:hypothetical protein [Methanoregula sp.]|jgi:hypothetical protein|uniref:hypothetical protein n=1 Tax=Methanoregula sp. TaxID=2052170 RepID=UPI003562814B
MEKKWIMAGIALVCTVACAALVLSLLMNAPATSAPQGSTTGFILETKLPESPATAPVYTVARIPEVNISTIPDLGSGSLRTNASFVAQIALQDRNVQKMISHGSIIRGVIDFTPSRPKEWNMSAGPTLWVDYRDIDVYFYVNETEQFIERYEIVVPGYLYRKERSNTGTCLLDKNGTVVLAFNTSEVWFPMENICSYSH